MTVIAVMYVLIGLKLRRSEITSFTTSLSTSATTTRPLASGGSQGSNGGVPQESTVALQTATTAGRARKAVIRMLGKLFKLLYLCHNFHLNNKIEIVTLL